MIDWLILLSLLLVGIGALLASYFMFGKIGLFVYGASTILMANILSILGLKGSIAHFTISAGSIIAPILYVVCIIIVQKCGNQLDGRKGCHKNESNTTNKRVMQIDKQDGKQLGINFAYCMGLVSFVASIILTLGLLLESAGAESVALTTLTQGMGSTIAVLVGLIVTTFMCDALNRKGLNMLLNMILAVLTALILESIIYSTIQLGMSAFTTEAIIVALVNFVTKSCCALLCLPFFLALTKMHPVQFMKSDEKTNDS